MKALFSTMIMLISLSYVNSRNKHLQSTLAAIPETQIIHTNGKTPLVEGFGWVSDYTLFNFGIGFKFALDAFIGYEFPVSYLNNAGNHALFEPKLYVEGSTHNSIELFFGIFSFRFNFDFIGIRYNFLEVAYLWSIDDYTQYCYGLDWSTSALKFHAKVEEFTNECSFGALGFLIDRIPECRSRRYTPKNDVYSYSVLDTIDKDGSYLPYTCN
ncbi:UNKNOWN [Stylonychia lemnae]|uniref:Uncharacterized protein n=1 Tax=Stylonychia lemnae TaxID=5949 RepID=A0A078AKZ5_STYLE|nr:UNKNOWN [Stylonychia lemnae]|eukprot:CDW81508.1 UNKNOWN [Stylonychia lemnae]